MHWTVRLRRWWQRNFGHVYLTETKWNGETACYRFKARFGKVALCWTVDFVCRLAPNGDIINHGWEKMRGFGKPYPGWKWSYEPVGTVIGKGGEMTREEILERLRKMKVLADRGVGGERENAERLLVEIAAEHGINLANLEEEKLSDFHVTLKEVWKRKMLSQLCALKRQELKMEGASLEGHRMTLWSCKGANIYAVHNCTKAEWLELMAKLEVLARAYKRQQEDFYHAFLMANDLLLEPDDEAKPLSREERSRLFRIAQMSRGIEKSQLNKQLTVG